MDDEGRPPEASEISVDGGDFVGRDKIVLGDDVHGDKIVQQARSDREDLLDYLDRAVAEYEARMYQRVVRHRRVPKQPYKFLYAFELEDEGIFFGRDAASEALHKVVLRDRLTVLHARSGAGKTSLLNAGLSPRLIREGRLPVYARAYEDLVPAIKRAIAPPSLGPWPELLSKLSLHEFLGLACEWLGRQTLELVIVVLRGGSWGDSAEDARCAFRFRSAPHNPLGPSGFRVVVSPVSTSGL